MSIPDPPPPTPRGSSLESLVEAVTQIYASIEADQRRFLEGAAARGAALACPPGCGSCCEPFVPDILPPEAALIAAWLIESAPELAREASRWARDRRPAEPPCPFFRRPGSPGPCAIYPVRPLVCRLFGAAGLRDREGRAAFRPCSFMPLAGYPPVGEERPAITGAELLRVFGSEPPLMADYAARLSALRPSEAGRASIIEALPAALASVGLALSLAEGACDRTYSGDHEGEE